MKCGPLAAGPDPSVSGAHCMMAGEPEAHEKTTHAWYVLDGSATVVSGEGSNVQGGQTQVFNQGQRVIVIPAGSPHWWKEVSQSITRDIAGSHGDDAVTLRAVRPAVTVASSTRPDPGLPCRCG